MKKCLLLSTEYKERIADSSGIKAEQKNPTANGMWCDGDLAVAGEWTFPIWKILKYVKFSPVFVHIQRQINNLKNALSILSWRENKESNNVISYLWLTLDRENPFKYQAYSF